LPSASEASFRIAGFSESSRPSDSRVSVRSAAWPRLMSPCGSVRGTLRTSGRLPPAARAWKVVGGLDRLHVDVGVGLFER
jgi:hypothetical protein